MSSRAERVNVSVRTSGGRTGIREPGTPERPGVSAVARQPVSVKECAPLRCVCQGVCPPVSARLYGACPAARGAALS